MIKINNENVKELNYGKKTNDYLYILLYCYLFDKDYRCFINKELKSKHKKSWFCILDNSLYEWISKGYEPISNKLFVDKIKPIYKLCKEKNKLYILIPDYLNDKQRTIINTFNFLNQYSRFFKESKFMAAIQGKNLKELIDCYKVMIKLEKIKRIGIPFSSKAFKDLVSECPYNEQTKMIIWAKGRQRFIKYLIDNDLINKNIKLHNLGMTYAKEYKNNFYKKVIDSCDTSNPVVCGIKKDKYNKNGNSTKYKYLICDNLNIHLDKEQKKIINYNIKIFKKLVKGI